MPDTFNANPTVETLQDALNMSADLRQNAVTRYFEEQAAQHNALKQFTSVYDPKRSVMPGGVGSIFIEKTDLSKGGGDTVVFNTIGIPGGRGARGGEELTGRTSTARKGTYKTTVDWVRDGFELTEDEIEFLAAGRSLEQTTIDLLAIKMGLTKQNHQLKRLILGTNGNVYRPNNRASVNDLIATDTLSVDITVNASAILANQGAKPLKRNTAITGCPVDNHLIFAHKSALLPVRNDSSFGNAISQGDQRGAGNSNFTGEIMKWQGNSFYDFPVTDIDWDDFMGGPLVAKAKLGTAFTVDSAAGDTKLITNADNTNSLFFQWFDGYEFVFNRVETPEDLSGNEYYAWIVNPDGTLGFVAYDGGFDGNQIVVTKILSFAGSGGTSTKGATTVGELKTDTAAWTGGVSTLPVDGPNGAWSYTDEFDADAMIFQANSKGVPYTRSFALGGMAGVFAHGRIKMVQIEQKRDWDFVHGKGYKMIFGTNVCQDTLNKPRNYLTIEHAYEHPGFPLPSKV